MTEKMRVYRERIKNDPTDTAAYVALGALEENQEFYSSAIRRLLAARALGAPEKDFLLPLGRALSRLSRWDEAEAELKKAVQLMPGSVEAAANLAGVYYSSGSARQAAEVLRAYVRRHRNADRTLQLPLADLRRLMLCFSEANDMQMCATLANEVLRISPSDAGAHALIGQAMLLKGRHVEAVPHFERAVSLEPNVASLCYNYAVALEHAGREGEALKQLQKCVSLNPNAMDAFLEMGALFERQKDWKRAAAALSSAALLSKDNTRVLYRAAKANERAGNLPEANHWYSYTALTAGRYQEALAYSKKLLQAPEEYWRTVGLLNAAEAYYALHRMDEYLAAMKKSAGGSTAQDDLRLAGAYQKADLLEKQVEYLNRAMQKDARLAPEAHYAIAETLLRRGLRDEAEKELEQAVAGDPQNAEYHAQLGDLYLARRTKGDRLHKALSELQQVVKLNPKDHSGYQSLGIAYAAAGDYGRAAFCLEHAIDLEPGYGPSYQELGRVYAKMGDKEASEKMLALYRKYVRYDLRLKSLVTRADQNKNDAGAQVELADLQASTGDLAGALQSYGMALYLKPKDATIQRKYDRVMELLTHQKAVRTASTTKSASH